MTRLTAALALAVLVTACTNEPAPSPSSEGSGVVPTVLIAGVATAGPTCPVVTEPPDPGCADRPVVGAAVRILDEAGSEVATVLTDAEGRFSVTVAPGTYQLVPQPVAGLMGTASPVTIELEAGVASEPVTLAYDTGIR